MSEEEMHRDFDAAEIQEMTSLVRTLHADDFTRDPLPDDLWGDIAAQLRAEQVPTPEASATATESGHTATVLRFPLHRGLLAVAAAALVAVLAIGVVAVTRSDDATVVATSDLDSLAAGYLGSAELAEADDGYRLDLELGELPPADGYYELWLIKSLETGEMQSLGFVDGSGSVALPPGLDPAEYATVDISIEPLDGVPTHSGNSVLRGTLQS